MVSSFGCVNYSYYCTDSQQPQPYGYYQNPSNIMNELINTINSINKQNSICQEHLASSEEKHKEELAEIKKDLSNANEKLNEVEMDVNRIEKDTKVLDDDVKRHKKFLAHFKNPPRIKHKSS